MRRFLLPATAAVLSAALLPVSAHAQGTVSAQGLGYPSGQLSTWALGTAGAVAELDPSTPLNPAAIALANATTIFAHYAPESRKVSIGDASDESRLSRFPLLGAVLPVGTRGYVGVAASSLLDRTWATVRTYPSQEGGEGTVETFQSTGGMTDVRAAGAWSFSQRFQVGLGAHVLTGDNRLTVSRIDRDRIDADFEQRSDVTYTGIAASAGMVWAPSRLVSVGMSGQVGGEVRAKFADSVVATATSPARAGATVRLAAISGATISARAEWNGWSSLDGLGREGFEAMDTWGYGVGADIVGPAILSTPVSLRLGAQRRDLPFPVLGVQPKETAYSGGFGLPLARGRVLLDFAVQRASRSAAAADETAWTYGVGVTVRP
ncbi:MAG: hypothetical protein ACYC2G_06800 [Gemmatimonadaceae bacterium]